METFDFNTRFAEAEDLLHRNLGDELVLLHLGSEEYFSLDEVGTRMFECVTQGDPLEAVHAQLLSEFEVESESLKTDLLAFCQRLTEQGLLVVV